MVRRNGQIFFSISLISQYILRTCKTRIHLLDRWIVRKQVGIMPTYHYMQNQGKLMMESRENSQKPQFGNSFLTFSRSDISKLQFFLKNRFQSNWRSYLVLASDQKPKKIVRAVFEKNIKVSDFGLIWRPFRQYHQIKNFFSKIRLCD